MRREYIWSTFCAVGLIVFLAACAPQYGDSRDFSGWSAQRAAIDARLLSLITNGRFEVAAELADSMLAAGWRDPRLIGQKATVIGALGKIDEAIGLFEEAIIEDYAGCDNHLNFAVLLMRSGKSGRAITELNEAKRFCGGANRLIIRRNLAVGYIETNKRDKAFEEVEAGLVMDPHDPYLLGLKGMLIAETDPALAESLLAIPIEAGTVEVEFLYHYGILLFNGGRPDRAVEVLSEASKRRPVDHGMREALARSLHGAGRLEEAEALYRELSEQGSDVSFDLARTLMDQKRFGEALELMSALPPTAEVLDRSAMCLFNLGRNDEALTVGRRAIAARPDWPVAMINTAVMLAAQGELEEARTLLERVLEIDSGNETASANLERIRDALEGVRQGEK